MEEQRKNLQKYAKEYYLMGNECIIHARDSKAAIANYDKALELDPLLVDAWVRKGVTLYNESEYYDAEACFNTAVNLSPLLFKAVYNRGKNRLTLGNYEGAIADLDRACSIKPEHALAHERLGDAFSKTGDMYNASLQWALAEKLREAKEEE